MINLFYPASFLPHKNHKLLNHALVSDYLSLHAVKIYLTISESDMSFSSSNIVLLGRLSHKSCLHYLQISSSLLFLSSFESLGLPLIEAAQLQKPCICPDLPYSRELLGDSPYFYSDMSVISLISAIKNFSHEISSPRSSILTSSPISINRAWNRFVSSSYSN